MWASSPTFFWKQKYQRVPPSDEGGVKNLWFLTEGEKKYIVIAMITYKDYPSVKTSFWQLPWQVEPCLIYQYNIRDDVGIVPYNL